MTLKELNLELSQVQGGEWLVKLKFPPSLDNSGIMWYAQQMTGKGGVYSRFMKGYLFKEKPNLEEDYVAPVKAKPEPKPQIKPRKKEAVTPTVTAPLIKKGQVGREAAKFLSKKKEEKLKDNQVKASNGKVITFPTSKPDTTVIANTSRKTTYEECKAKLDKEREIFKDKDSAYVAEGLLAMCKVDQNFRNNFIREEKTYAKAFDFFIEMSKNGYGVMYDGNRMSYFDNDIALATAIEYYNIDEEKIKDKIKAKGES